MIKYLIVVVVLVGCGMDWESNLSKMEPPIIVIGKDHKEYNSDSDIVIRDKNNKVLRLIGHQWTKNYNVGDTLK